MSGTLSLNSHGSSAIDMESILLSFIIPLKLLIFVRSRGSKFKRICSAVSLFVNDLDTSKISRSFKISISVDDETDFLVFRNLRPSLDNFFWSCFKFLHKDTCQGQGKKIATFFFSHEQRKTVKRKLVKENLIEWTKL